MGERIKKITRKIKRAFKPKEPPPTRKLSVSHVIRPEDVVNTTRPKLAAGLDIETLKWGVTHVKFDTSSISYGTIAVRDPVTRRLGRRRLDGGMRRVTGYYDKSGELFSESRTNWK